MKWLIASGIQSRLVVASIAALLIIFGSLQLRDMQLGVFPEFSPVYVEVQTEALGLSAEEIEEILTVALEQDLLNGIAYLDEIWSESIPGLSRVVCVFEPGTDPMVARQVVAERLTQAHALPNVSKPPTMLQPYSSTSRIMMVGLSPKSPDLSLIDLSVLTRWTIQPYLMGIEGVANVSIWGQRKRQLQVLVDPKTLGDRGVALQDVIKTTGEALWVSPLTYLNSSTPGTGGFFDTPNQRLGITHLLPISSPEDLAQIPVHDHEMSLGDIATVVEDHQPLIGDAIVNGRSGLLLVIEKFPWASTRQVSENVERALDALSPGLTGVAFDTEIYQPADFIEVSFDNFAMAMGLGLLAMALLLLFFYEWRTALIGLVSIVLSLLTGAYVLHLQGTIFDLMVMAGFFVALGVVVDDAITNLDNIRRHLNHRRQEGSTKTDANLILEAALEIRSPIFFATAILVLAVLPLFFIEGISGAFVGPLALSYLLALAASTLTALLVTPALSVMFLSSSSNIHRDSPLLSSLCTSFATGVQQFMQKPIASYSTLAIMALVGIVAFFMIDWGPRVPIPKERDLLIQWEGAYGTSHPEMVRVTTDAISKLRTIPGIENAAGHLGRAVMSDKINNVHAGEIWICMDEEVDYDQTISSIEKVLADYSHIKSKITTYRRQVIDNSLIGTDHLYAVRVYGENQDILKQKVEEVHAAVSTIRDFNDVQVDYPPMEPTIEIEVDLEKARNHGIKPGDVRRTAATLLAGIEVGSLFEGQKVFGVVVWGVPEVRNSINSVRNLLVDTPDGSQVRIGDVAEVREKQNPAVIRREKVSQYIDVTFNSTRSNLKTITSDVNALLAQVDFPLEYHAELVGDFAEIKEAKKRVLGIVIASLIGIFLLLQAAFWSWRLASVVFPSMIAALSGGLLITLLNGGLFTLGGLAGLLAVFGMASYHGVLLIKHFKQLEMNEVPFGTDLILQGVKNRLGPILMTTIITAVALLPFAFFGNAPGMEILHPMALVALGGLVTTLVVTLFVLPALYRAFGSVTEEVIAEEKSFLELDVVEEYV